jgi:hypothetical protein
MKCQNKSKIHKFTTKCVREKEIKINLDFINKFIKLKVIEKNEVEERKMILNWKLNVTT